MEDIYCPTGKDGARKFIDTADKYTLAGLKMNAEASHVAYFDFTARNAAEELLYADAENCLLLREELITFISKNAKQVTKSKSFENIFMAKM